MRLCRPERLKEDVEDCILPRRSPFKKREVALFLSAGSANFFMDDAKCQFVKPDPAAFQRSAAAAAPHRPLDRMLDELPVLVYFKPILTFRTIVSMGIF